MLKAKYNNPLINFVIHGMKEIDGYTYLLLIDKSGQTVGQRINADSSEGLFALKDDQETISEFWTDIADKDFTYLHQL